MDEKIRVLVVGSSGKMGQEVVKMVESSKEFELVGLVDINTEHAYTGSNIVYMGADLQEGIRKSNPKVVVDFTHPEVVMENARIALEERVSMVIGTTGLTVENLEEIHVGATQAGVGVLVAPNFAIGAVLMIELSKQVAKHFSEVEIIEMHNPLKADSPSGTALKTVEEISKSLEKTPTINDSSVARGKIINNIPVHSVRLPGMVAHQQVIFGGKGQTLTIRHDSFDRSSFMPGVAIAIKKIIHHSGLVYGLEKLLDLN